MVGVGDALRDLVSKIPPSELQRLRGKGETMALDDEDGFEFRVDENETRTEPSDRYIGIQCDINEEKRSTLIDFIVSLHVELELDPEILYLTVRLIDYSLHLHHLPASDLHNLGLGALLTAWRYLDEDTVDVDYLMSVTNSFSSKNICSKKKILKMEKTSLQELEYGVGDKTQYEYLLKFIEASRSDPEVEDMVHYLSELGMVHLETTRFHPSLWAAATIYTVRCCLDKSPPWTDALESLTKYSENQLMDCSKLLFSKHSEASRGSNLRAVPSISYYSSLPETSENRPPAPLLLPSPSPSSCSSLSSYFPLCPKNFNYLPDPSTARQYSIERHYWRERHCPDLAKEKFRCLVPKPSGYKTPFPWPDSRSYAWFKNVPFKRLAEFKKSQNWVRLDGDPFVFPGGGTSFPGGVKDYVDVILRILPLASGSIRTVLDIGCGVASFGAFLLNYNILTKSIAPRDIHEAQVQFALERGLPAMLGVLSTYKLPYPSRCEAFSTYPRTYDLIHANGVFSLYLDKCDIVDILLEMQRILRPEGAVIIRDRRPFRCSYQSESDNQ
ncbi:Cyclin-like superfamily [Arabidopsis suecica]|uniref:Methyltransferase n=1 Tax=Arabidopsis suecica TaxID=45249 RepID=A0A8T2AP54_ARASU|nr:Cyclin-like superfamily [Arabidopsis suecica]